METPDPKHIFRVTDFLDVPYKLERSRHYDEFLCELGVLRNTRLQAIDSKPTVSVSKTDKIYTLCTAYPEGRVVKVRFKNGERIERQRQVEGQTSSVFYVVGNKIREEQTVDGKYVVMEWEFGPKEMVLKLMLNKVKCYRWYNVVVSNSIPSFATETSRRVSAWEIDTPPIESETRTTVKDEDSSVEIFRRCH